MFYVFRLLFSYQNKRYSPVFFLPHWEYVSLLSSLLSDEDVDGHVFLIPESHLSTDLYDFWQTYNVSFWGKLRNYKMIFVTRIWLFWFSDLLVQEPICNARRFKTNWDQLWKSFSPVLYLFIYILKFHHTVRDILVYQSFSTSHPYRSFQVERWDLCERISRFLFRCKIYWYFFHILVIVLYFYMLSCSTLIKNFGETCISQKVAVE